ncbi:hypothetical protein AB4084_14220, partial [Lysobacter sp. 2RAB21]
GHSACIRAHRRVFDAIKAGDPVAAHAAMSSIIADVLVLIEDAQSRETDQGKARKRVEKTPARSKK